MYLERIMSGIPQINSHVAPVAKLLLETWVEGGTVYIAGNGGSASTSQHFATDLQKVLIERKIRGKVSSLSDNISSLTMIANDYSFAEVYSKQLELYLMRKDLLICISASGNSENIRRAIEVTKSRNVKSIGITGFDGGWLSENCSIPVILKTDIGDYGVAEDLHIILCHAVKEYLMNELVI